MRIVFLTELLCVQVVLNCESMEPMARNIHINIINQLHKCITEHFSIPPSIEQVYIASELLYYFCQRIRLSFMTLAILQKPFEKSWE